MEYSETFTVPSPATAMDDTVFLTALMGAVHDPVLRVDAGGVIGAANPAAARLLGGSAASLIGRSLISLVPGPDRAGLEEALRQICQVASDSTAVDSLKVETLTPDRANLRMELTLIRVRQGTGGEAVVVLHPAGPEGSSGFDRASEERMSTLAHDLRGPLNTLLMGLQYFRMSGLLQEHERAEAVVARSEAAGAQMMRMIELLVDTEHLRAGRLELIVAPVRMSELWEPLLAEMAPLAARRDARLSVALAPDMGTVLADRSLLERLLSHLLEHALKSGPAGSDLEIAVEIRDAVAVVSVTRNPAAGDPRQPVPSALGLELDFCRLAAAVQGGRFREEADGIEGGRWMLEFPLVD